MSDLSLEKAQALHRKERFKPYKGPKLEGERTVIDIGSPGFPEALRQIDRPPKQLYVIGDAAALVEGLAIVGARNATPYGLSCAAHFSEHAAAKGVNIISGGALGCDSAAHEAAIKAHGTTTVFLGGGCDELYPARNQALFQKIVESGGAIVSEHCWDYPPLRHTFRSRNRLIAGLARATLIVEAGLPSGTFSTADEALSASREVLVVPGSINSSTSRGANRLLYQGATPIVDDESFDDALFSLFGILKQESFTVSQKNMNTELPANKKTQDDPRYAKLQEKLFAALCAQPLKMEEMLSFVNEQDSNLNAREALMMCLTDLQKEGLIARYPDGSYGTARFIQ